MVKHHQEIIAGDPGGTLIRCHFCPGRSITRKEVAMLLAGPPDRQPMVMIASQCDDAEQIDEDKDAAAVLAGDVGETPHVTQPMEHPAEIKMKPNREANRSLFSTL